MKDIIFSMFCNQHIFSYAAQHSQPLILASHSWKISHNDNWKSNTKHPLVNRRVWILMCTNIGIRSSRINLSESAAKPLQEPAAGTARCCCCCCCKKKGVMNVSYTRKLWLCGALQYILVGGFIQACCNFLPFCVLRETPTASHTGVSSSQRTPVKRGNAQQALRLGIQNWKITVIMERWCWSGVKRDETEDQR